MKLTVTTDREVSMEGEAAATGCCRKIPLRGVLAVIGGILIHLTLGTQLTFGNTNPYFVSYIRKHSSPSDLHYIEGIWVQACMLMGQGVTMFLGGILEQKLGLRIACLIGSWTLSAGVLATYFTLKVNYLTSVLTYGVVFGLGCGVAYPMPVTCAMRWFPNHRGLMGGLIFVGFGSGSTIFNQIITLYLNPDNISPDLTIGEDIYFTQDEVLDKVPTLFLVLGGTYAAMQLLGVLMMSNPPASNQQDVTQDIASSANTESTSAASQEKYAKRMDVWSINVSENDVHCDVTSEPAKLETSKVETPLSSDAPPETDTPPTESSSGPAEEDGKTEEEVETVEMDIPPLKMLRTKQFYLVWLLFLFGGMGGVFMASMYKSYGQSFIKDDQFIAVVGSVAAVFNAIGGVFWGHVADRFGFNVTAKLLYTLFACTSFTFIGSEFGLKPYFLIWVCLILFAISGKFTIMPPVIARMYGNKYMSTNYGLLYTSQILTSAASAFMGEMLKDILHYNGLFFLIGGMSCIGFVITFFVNARTPDGKRI